MEPEIILMDEPLANLDYPSVKMVLSTLIELKKKGVTVIIVSHEAEKLLSLTDNTIILSEGRLVDMGARYLFPASPTRSFSAEAAVSFHFPPRRVRRQVWKYPVSKKDAGIR